MPLSTPIKDILDEDHEQETEEVKEVSKKGKKSSYYVKIMSNIQDPLMILLASYLCLSLDVYSISMFEKAAEMTSENIVRSLLIAVLFVLMKLLYNNVVKV